MSRFPRRIHIQLVNDQLIFPGFIFGIICVLQRIGLTQLIGVPQIRIVYILLDFVDDTAIDLKELLISLFVLYAGHLRLLVCMLAEMLESGIFLLPDGLNTLASLRPGHKLAHLALGIIILNRYDRDI